MRLNILILMLTGVLLSGSNTAHAWLRPVFEDATVVERSELIVVAHLKKGSIEYVPHKKGQNEGASWEHHAALVIKEVLKGKCGDKEIPVIIHYGLSPVVRGNVRKDNLIMDQRAGGDDSAEGGVAIHDTGNSSLGGGAILENANQDNLWFLRRRSGIYGRQPGTGTYGVVDPEDIQSLKWKGYFLAYMADDPETAIRTYIEQNPNAVARAKRYLDHLAVKRTLKIADPEERCSKLLPFFLSRTTWNMKTEAREGVVSCGKTAGKQLRKIFDDPEHAEFRDDIILLWRDLGYKESVPLLIDMLEKHDRYWARQKLQEGWWNADVASELTRRRRNTYGEVYYGVSALRTFKDPRARSILQKTRHRWKTINFSNSQIMEECEAALRGLATPE